MKYRSGDKSIKYLLEKAIKLQETSVMWFGPKMIIAVVTPEDVKTVLSSPECYEKAELYYEAFHNLGSYDGLLFSKITKWKRNRRLMNSSFNVHRVTSLFANTNKIANDFIVRLENYCTKDAFNVFPLMLDVSVDLTIKVHFNKTLAHRDVSAISHDIERTFKNIWRKMVEYSVFYPLYILKQALSIDVIAYDALKSNCSNIMKEKYKLYTEINNDDDDAVEKKITEEEIRKHHEIFINRVSRLIHNGYLTMDQGIDHLILLVQAGSDTTATTLSNIMLLIAMHQDIQEKLYNDIKTVLKDCDEEDNVLTLEDLNKFKYVEQVLKECLRLLPVTAVIARKPNKDIQLETGIIPSGTETIILTYSIHRNEKYWGPNADKFNPDNFLPEKAEKRHRCSFIPFSYGNRNCIASRYVQQFLKLMIIKIFSTYKLTTKLKLDEIQFKFNLTAIISSDYDIKIEKR